ncbi:SDR family oxidoreductase [Actinocorallia lasiicapitis]
MRSGRRPAGEAVWRTAVITGGASGIGRELGRALVGRGCTVVLADLDGDLAGATAAELSAAGPGETIAAALDVTDAAAVADLYGGIARDHGHLDLVFNNAGISVLGMAEELTVEHWDRAIDVNLRGVVHGVLAAYPIMLEQGHGHIVNTASVAGVFPSPWALPYTASKAGVVALSLGLRAEGALRGVGVTVVCPGYVDTPHLDRPNPGLPQTGLGRRARRLAASGQARLYSPQALARDVLRAVARNRPMVVAPASARLQWRSARIAPVSAPRLATWRATRAFRRASGR